jgi:hypothetical protein
MNIKLSKEHIRLLGLSRKEVEVLDALRAEKSTPLLISEYTKVSRPAIYEILVRLHKRGIIKSSIRDGKKYWSQAKERDLEQELYNIKKQFFDIEEGTEEVRGLSDSTVIVHRGATAIRKLIQDMFENHKDRRFYGIQGDNVVPGWNKIFSIEGTNELNRAIKKNGMIMEGILPHGFFERQTKALGQQWAKDFEGRAAVTHEIDEEYFQNAGQIFIFRNSLYLIAMNEEIIIEVRNSEIQKLILSMFRFIQDNSRKIDVNAILRELIKEEKVNEGG